MSKTSNKEESYSVELDLSTDAHPHILLIFLVLGLFLLFTYLFKNFQTVWFADKTFTDLPKYVWVSKSSATEQGLYYINNGNYNGYIPATNVSAIRFDSSGNIDQSPLPPKVANIFFMPIAINRADQELLSTLPGIGPALAERFFPQQHPGLIEKEVYHPEI